MTSESTFINSLQEEMVERDFPGADPSHLDSHLSEDWVKGKGTHTIKHRSKRFPPQPQKEADFSIHTGKRTLSS